MYSTTFFTLMLVAFASAAPSQPEQVSGSNSVSNQPQNVPVVGNAPVVQPQVGSSPVDGVVQPAGVEHHHHHSPIGASYYAPAGLMTIVGGEQQGSHVNKPSGSVRNFEQYGQPEPASLPANYKPFGSWGLYIGGNPADGYYTNYYKALGSGVEKQQAGEPAKPVAGGQTAAFSPMLRQAGSSPYGGGDYYPFVYSPAELNSNIKPVVSNVVEQGYSSSAPQMMGPISPVQAGAQVYGSPSAFESNYGVSPYADAYATKKLGAAYAQKEATKEAVAPPKGYHHQSRVYVYPSQAGAMASPVAPNQYSQGSQQVVAYPIPVGSQIVGSQPGVDGAFNPYGVHAFTRYAVKPTVVEPSYYYGVQSSNQAPVYKQHQQQQQSVQQQSGNQAGYYPMSFYGYPVNQLHYSQGSVVPQSVHPEGMVGGQNSQPIQPVHAIEMAASEKHETEDKSMKQQKKA